MEVVFTICSNNYLAHAATLIQSWFRFHPETIFYVILVDKKNPSIDYLKLMPARILEIESINLNNLDVLVEEYDITELNTAVKPSVLLYLFEKYPGSKIVYLDPDILVTEKFDEVFDALDYNDFVLTPHICYPVDDNMAPTDYHTLRTGIFNLGFIALKDTAQVEKFLLWWRDRVFKYGYCNLPENMFYDQLWANYIPVFYDKYFILKHAGYNMANWNLHERSLTQINEDRWIVNDSASLKFFHFSGYKFTKPDSIGSYHTRYTFSSRPDLLPIFSAYQRALLNNDVVFLSTIPCIYYEEHKRLKIEKEGSKQKEAVPASTKIKVLRKLASIARRIVYS